MADPTQANRDAIASGFKKLFPNSPLAQSGNQAALDRPEVDGEIPYADGMKAQPASMPNNNMAFVVPEVDAPNPTQTAPQNYDFNVDLPKEYMQGINEQRDVYMQNAANQEKISQDAQMALNKLSGPSTAAMDAIQRSEQLALEVEKDVQERAKMKGPEARNYFAGKSTWQKIVGGIGLALSALSPQSAQNAVKLIDDEVERDLNAQINNLNAKDKAIANKQSLVKQYYDKYKDMETARSLARAEIYQLAAFKAGSSAEVAKSKVAAGALRQAEGAAKQEAKLSMAKAMQSYMKLQQDYESKNSGRVIDAYGYKGLAPTEKEGQEFRAEAATTKNILDGVNELKGLQNKSGSSITPADRQKAAVAVGYLSGALRLNIVGPGAMSDSERELVKSIIANPTRIFSLSSSNAASLDSIAKKAQSYLNNKAKTFPNVRYVGSGEEL